MFGHALTGSVLRAHVDGPLRFGRLEETMPGVPQTSLRLALNVMRELGTLTKRPPVPGSPASANELTSAGRELLEVDEVLGRWLLRSPIGPLSLASAAGRNAVKTLVGGWNSGIVRHLAERPLTNTELSARIPALSHHSIGRQLAKLRSTSLIVQPPSQGRGRPCEATEWLRHSVAPLCVALRWERAHLGVDAHPVERLEAEAAFLLTLPLITLDRRIQGVCVLAVMTSAGEDHSQAAEVAGVAVSIEAGRLAYCRSGDQFSPRSWALGTPDAWLAAVIEGRFYELRSEGENTGLPIRIVQEIHERLFPS